MKYRTVFVCGHYADIPIPEPGWRMVEIVVRFPHVPLDPKYVQVKHDDAKVCAATLNLDTLKFSSPTPWDGRLINHEGKWTSEAARELARLIAKESI